jgi:serine/threonine protein kinase
MRPRGERLRPRGEAEKETTEPTTSTDGRFTIIDKLGSGGMGEVFLAEQNDLSFTTKEGKEIKNRVAIKTIDLESLGPEQKGRFERERQLYGELRNAPYLITTIDLVEMSDGQTGLVMEYPGGQGTKNDPNVRTLSELVHSGLVPTQTKEQQKSIKQERVNHDKTVEQTVVAQQIDTQPNLHNTNDRIKSSPEGSKESKEQLKVKMERVSQIGFQTCLGLHSLHESGFIHRDVKPDNMLVWKTPRKEDELHVRLIDFGIVKPLEAALQKKADTAETSLGGVSSESMIQRTEIEEGPDTEDQLSVFETNEGVTAGTLSYMAPESLAGDPLDERTDLYSLGTVMYQILSGKHPLLGGEKGLAPFEIMSRTISKNPADLHQVLGMEKPNRLTKIIMTLLEKDPDDRNMLEDGDKEIPLGTALEVATAIKQAMLNQAMADGEPMSVMKHPYDTIRFGMQPEQE